MYYTHFNILKYVSIWPVLRFLYRKENNWKKHFSCWSVPSYWAFCNHDCLLNQHFQFWNWKFWPQFLESLKVHRKAILKIRCPENLENMPTNLKYLHPFQMYFRHTLRYEMCQIKTLELNLLSIWLIWRRKNDVSSSSPNWADCMTSWIFPI